MIAEYADEIIKTHSEEYKDNPLFLYLPFQDVHSPLEVPDEYLDLYPNEKNRARQKFSGSKKKFFFYNMFVFLILSIYIYFSTAKVSALDASIAKIVTSLRENGLYENSLIVFTADVNIPRKDEDVFFNLFQQFVYISEWWATYIWRK